MCQAGYRWFQLANRADSRRGQVMSQKRAQDDEVHGGELVLLWWWLRFLLNQPKKQREGAQFFFKRFGGLFVLSQNCLFFNGSFFSYALGHGGPSRPLEIKFHQEYWGDYSALVDLTSRGERFCPQHMVSLAYFGDTQFCGHHDNQDPYSTTSIVESNKFFCGSHGFYYKMLF